MSDSSITLILNRFRDAATEEQRQAAATELFECYRGQVENVARGRLARGGGLADEEDVAQSAFRSFFDRIETGQLDALVNGGQAWAILARLTRNKAIDSIRYENAKRRGGDGGRANNVSGEVSNAAADSVERRGESHASASSSASSSRSRALGNQSAGSSRELFGRNRLGIGDVKGFGTDSIAKSADEKRRRDEVPVEAVQDPSQRCGAETAASKEAVEKFLERLNEATLRGIVTLKLQGFTNEEIGERLGCATRTVERKLGLIRRLWIPILEDSSEQRQA